MKKDAENSSLIDCFDILPKYDVTVTIYSLKGNCD